MYLGNESGTDCTVLFKKAPNGSKVECGAFLFFFFQFLEILADS